MNSVTNRFAYIREFVVSNTRGQTMTEYALMLAVIAVVVYAIYAAKGNNIGSLASGIEFRRMRRETSHSTRRARRPESRRLAFRWRTSKQT
jgi:Flp pilus assembly pilin Flp